MSVPQPYIPPGFDDFWHANVAEAEAAPLDYSVSAVPAHPTFGCGQTDPGVLSEHHEVRNLSFRGVSGETLYGWIALVPERNEIRGPRGSPAFLWVPPYGRESVMPNQYGTREGFVSLSFNFFGHDAFHQEKYTPDRGYFAAGVLDKDTWIFGSMFQNAVIATRVLCDLPEVDPARVGSMGMSQGGGMSIWLGAWSDRVKAVCADMPFLGALHETLLKNVYRYPLKELIDFVANVEGGQERLLRTLSYFDSLNQATRCDKPTLVSVGLKDPAVKPIQVHAIYSTLPGKKALKEYDCGHDWHADMIENNRRWLIENL